MSSNIRCRNSEIKTHIDDQHRDKTSTNKEKHKAKYENAQKEICKTEKSGTNSHWRPAQGALHMLAAKKQHPWRVFDSSLRKEKRETMFFFYNFQ